jgi:hypothetical protein
MQLDRTPIVERLADANRVLIAGAGGGFDFFSGLPLYFRLRERGQEVHLANLSWSRLDRSNERRLIHGVTRVDADSEGRADYFPEAYLCQWFRTHGEEIGVWCFPRLGGRPLAEAYDALVTELDVDAVVLVDGGTDILMRGDEERLGTPWEDIASLAAVDAVAVPRKFVVCLGFGVDAFHGVCHAHVLEAVAATIKTGGFLGAVSLLAEMPEVRRYLEAVEYVSARMPRSASIVCSSITSALEGEYGDHHRNARTEGSELWINPLMTLLWAFELEAVARRCIYLDAVKKTADMGEITRVIHDARLALGRVRAHVPIPV